MTGPLPTSGIPAGTRRHLLVITDEGDHALCDPEHWNPLLGTLDPAQVTCYLCRGVRPQGMCYCGNPWCTDSTHI